MTRTDMSTKDYLGEMKRCSRPKCRKLKDKSEFGIDCHNKDGLNHQCKKCKNKWARANHKRKTEAKFCKLNQPSFIYQNEHTTFLVEPVYRQGVAEVRFKAQIFSEYEEIGVDEIPVIKMKELRDWLNVKLKQEKKQ